MSVSLVDGHIDSDAPGMTLEETVGYFKDMVDGCGAYELCPCGKDDMEMTKIALDALKRQIPKKPDYEADGYDENGNLIYDHAICPNCGNDDFEYDINNWGCKFCPDCGQALDWGDTE